VPPRPPDENGLADDDGAQCVDITFADPKDVPEVTEENCANTTNIGFELVFTTRSESSAAPSRFLTFRSWLISIPLAALIAWGGAL
jgi:hypothetical protein